MAVDSSMKELKLTTNSACSNSSPNRVEGGIEKNGLTSYRCRSVRCPDRNSSASVSRPSSPTGTVSEVKLDDRKNRSPLGLPKLPAGRLTELPAMTIALPFDWEEAAPAPMV